MATKAELEAQLAALENETTTSDNPVRKFLNDWPIATIVIVLLTLVYSIPGAVLVIKGDMTYEDYSKGLLGFAAANGILASARAYLSGKKVENAAPPTPPA